MNTKEYDFTSISSGCIGTNGVTEYGNWTTGKGCVGIRLCDTFPIRCNSRGCSKKQIELCSDNETNEKELSLNCLYEKSKHEEVVESIRENIDYHIDGLYKILNKISGNDVEIVKKKLITKLFPEVYHPSIGERGNDGTEMKIYDTEL